MAAVVRQLNGASRLYNLSRILEAVAAKVPDMSEQQLDKIDQYVDSLCEVLFDDEISHESYGCN